MHAADYRGGREGGIAWRWIAVEESGWVLQTRAELVWREDNSFNKSSLLKVLVFM